MTAYDVCVIGGGINGVGIARDAAGRGLSVILCEKGDLGEGTSSKSSKYIHGGLRYLEYYQFRLVREALGEREVIMGIAPHISHPLRLHLIHSKEQRPRWLIRLGLFLYDNLSKRKQLPASTAVDFSKIPHQGVLKTEYKRGFSYSDGWVDDARLVVLNAVDAHQRGAEIAVRTAFTGAKKTAAGWEVTLVSAAIGEYTVQAKSLVNAAGPWVENTIRNIEHIKKSRNIRLVKGSHIITKRWWQGDHGYVLQNHDKRIVFVSPYFADLALIGTTDTPYVGAVEDVAIDDQELSYLLSVCNRYFTHQLRADDVLTTYSGVRPLFDDDAAKNASAVSRDYLLDFDRDTAMLNVFGGKLTTYRKLAFAAVNTLQPLFPNISMADWTGGQSLPGGEYRSKDLEKVRNGFVAAHAWLDESLALLYFSYYGKRAESMLAGKQSMGDLGKHFGGQLFEAEVRWLQQHEWAHSAADIIWRRTKHGLWLSKPQIKALATWLEENPISA